jgi:hypothetical protein
MIDEKTGAAYERPWGHANPPGGAAADHLASHNRLGAQIRGDWSGSPVGPDDRAPAVAAIHRSLYTTTEGNQ